MQRKVITALIENLMSTKNILKLPNIANIVIENTNTNVTVRECMKYLQELKEIDTKNIISNNMPLDDIEYVVNGTSCVLVNEFKAREIISTEWIYVAEETEEINNIK